MKAPPYVVLGLQDSYIDLADYEFRFSLDPDVFQNSKGSVVVIRDSDGNEIPSRVRSWGRKLTCQFTLDEDVSDGLATIEASLRDTEGKNTNARLTTWVIKP